MGSISKYADRSVQMAATAIILTGNARGTDLTTAVTPAAQTAALTGGLYDIWSDVDIHIKVAETATDVTTTNGYLLRANNTIPLVVGDGEKIGAIGNVGTLRYHKVN